MQKTKQEFIQLCLANQVLKFGEFTLKSGRQSHYFFNAGLFYTSTALIELGEFYADLINSNIIQKNISFDCLFGPAYKGIPLVTATAIALEKKYGYKTSIAYNRKEAKTHGEGGMIIGQDLTNKKVVLIDDVITAGTATKESINLLKQYNASIIALTVALNRQEPANNTSYKTSADEITAEYELPIYSIASFTDILEFTENTPEYNNYANLLRKQ